MNEKINYSLRCLSKSCEGCGEHNRTGLCGLFKFFDLSNEIEIRNYREITKGQLICL